MEDDTEAPLVVIAGIGASYNAASKSETFVRVE